MATQSDPIKCVSASMSFGEKQLSFSMLPNGEKRVSTETVGPSFGYKERWFYNRSKRGGEWLKQLQRTGFDGAQIWTQTIQQDAQGRAAAGYLAKTISLRDFIKLTTYEAISRRNLDAIILLSVFAEVGIEKVVEDLFAGRSIDFILEKIAHYSQWTYEELEEVLAYNREDKQDLILGMVR